MALHHTLPIYKVTYDLLRIITEMTRNMPRDYKQSIGGRIREESVAIVMLIYRANVATSKTPHINELLERLQVIELLLRLSCDMHLISKKQYAACIDLTGSAGKQANGWKKVQPRA